MFKFRDLMSHRIDTRRGRLASFWYTELVDHAFLRRVWTNVKEIDDGVFRSNHPTPARLRDFKRSGGASVLNLRGAVNRAPMVIGRHACTNLGLEYHVLAMASCDLPSRSTVLTLLATLQDLPRPVLMHCKSGADRTGLASGIYLMAFKGASPREAAKQLTWRHAHNKFSKKAILHRFFEMYQPAYDAGQDFVEWVRSEYEPGAEV